MENIRFVTYSREFLDCSWFWLNDPEVKKLTSTPSMTRDIQHKWFANLENMSNYRVWGIEYEDNKIGVLGLKNINVSSAEYFGYIGEKRYWNRGLSKLLLDHVVKYATENRIPKVWLRVIKENPRAIRSYEKYGFKTYQETEGEFYMSLDVLC